MPLVVGEHTELYRLFVRTTCCKFGGSAFGVCWHKGRKSWNWGPCDLPNSTFCQLLFPFPVPVSSWREKASPTKQVVVLMVTITLLLGRGGNPNYNIWIHIIFVFLLRAVPVAQWPEKDCMEAWVNFECGKNTGKLILRGVVQNVTLRAVNLHEQKGLQ